MGPLRLRSIKKIPAAYLGQPRIPAAPAPCLQDEGMDSPSGPAFCCLQVFLPALNHSVFYFIIFLSIPDCLGLATEMINRSGGEPTWGGSSQREEVP